MLVECQLQNVAGSLNVFPSSPLKLGLAPLIRRRLRLKDFDFPLLQQDLCPVRIRIAAIRVIGILLDELIEKRQGLIELFELLFRTAKNLGVLTQGDRFLERNQLANLDRE